MGDILDPAGRFLPWDCMVNRGIPPLCRNAYLSLVGSVKSIPQLHPSTDPWKFFVEDFEQRKAWLCLLPPQQTTARWIPFMDRS